MKNNKKKNKKNTLFNKLGALLFGMFFIITAFNILEIEKDKIEYMETNGEPAEATIVRVPRSSGKKNKARPIIAYEFEGKEYTGTMNYYFFLLKKGDTVEVWVDPENPESFIESDNTTIGLIYLMMFIGAAMPASAFIPDVIRNFRGE